MMADDGELGGIDSVVVVPAWLKGLIRAVRSEAWEPKDARVKPCGTCSGNANC